MLEIRNIHKSFGSTPVLGGIDLDVNQGDVIAIIGPSGSGKTTLLNVLSSFLPNRERIVTIEDAAELQLHQEHLVRLEDWIWSTPTRARWSLTRKPLR